MTVRPPSGICATVPSHTASASLRTQTGSAATRRDASQATSVSTIEPNAITRLPNSMNAWPPFSGKGVEPHRGQLSQPRPDAGQPDDGARRHDDEERQDRDDCKPYEAGGRDVTRPRAGEHRIHATSVRSRLIRSIGQSDRLDPTSSWLLGRPPDQATSATPAPASIRPMRRRKRSWPANVASSTVAFSAGSEISSPPAVWGS